MSKKIKITTILLIIILVVGIATSRVIGVDDTPANTAFEDINLYKCVVDAYNQEHSSNTKQYSYSLSDAELNSITVLSCEGLSKSDNEKITSTKGIEKLTQLTTLNLNWNNISTIDVSKNTKLTDLRLEYNKLNAIDVKANSLLKYLYLYSNNLSEIDVKSNLQLLDLRLEENNLSEIDVKANTQLTTLELWENNLSTIDVSKNTQLISLRLNNNNLSTIDVRANTQLTTLELSGNNLNAIDVKANTQLTNMDLRSNKISEIDVSKNTQLKYLFLGRNNLSAIDLRANTQLRTLNLDYNNLSAIDVQANTQLDDFSLSNNNLSAIDISMLTQLTKLQLNNNNISAINLSRNTKLTQLWLYQNSLSAIDVRSNTQLTDLRIGTNNLNEIDVSQNTKLTQLWLNNNNLSAIDLKANTQLTNLDLENNNLNAIDVKANTKLTSLDLSDNNLNAIDVKANTQLTNLDLDNNNLSSIDVQANTKLITLKLKKNNLSTIDVSQNTLLRTFDISNNKLLSINIDGLNDLILVSSSNLVSRLSTQIREIEPNKQNNKYTINLKEYDSKLDPSKVSLNQNGVEYDNATGIISFTKKPTRIYYTYITGKEQNMQVIIMIPNEQPVITTFYIGGESNPEYATSTTSSVYLSWNDEDVSHYCISKENSSDSCKWQSTSGKSVNASYTLEEGDGTKTLYAFIKDDGELISEGKSDSILLNATAPTITTFYIGGENNPKYANSTTSSIYLTWNDEDVSHYCISKENSSDSCDWQSASDKQVSTSYTLDSGDGTKTLYAYIKDVYGLISEVKSDLILLDTTKPTITTFYIGGQSNPEYATSTTSSIYLTWNDEDVTHYCISKTSSSALCDWQSTSGKQVSTSYTLDSGDVEKTLYAYIKDEAGLVSELASDSIILDTTKPTITTFYIGGESNPEYATSTTSSMYLTWNDEDVTHYCISKEKSSASCDWKATNEKEISEEYILSGDLGSQTRYAYIKDKAGLISELKEDSIILQTEKPLIKEFYIGGKENPKYAKSIESKIYLRHEEEDIEAYCLTTSNDSSNCEWINTDKKEIEAEITLNSGDGVKIKYAFLKNKAGLISEVASDSIILDTTIPEIKVFSIGGISNPEKIESNETSIYLMWEDDDVVNFCINTEENSANCEWTTTSGKEIVQDYTLASGDGEKILYAYIKDEAGYISKVKTDSIMVIIPVVEEVPKDEPLPESPQTGGYTIGLILVGGIVLGLTYKYYISKKDKLKRI